MSASTELAVLLAVSYCLNGTLAVGALETAANFLSSDSHGSKSLHHGGTDHGHVIVRRSIEDYVSEQASKRRFRGSQQALSDGCNHRPASVISDPLHPSLQTYLRSNYIGSAQPGAEAAGTYDIGAPSARRKTPSYLANSFSPTVDLQEAAVEPVARMPRRGARRRFRGRRGRNSKRRKARRRRRRRFRKRKGRGIGRSRRRRFSKRKGRNVGRRRRPRFRKRRGRSFGRRRRPRRNRRNDSHRRPRFGGTKVRKYSRLNRQTARRRKHHLGYLRRSGEQNLEEAKEEHRDAVAAAAEASVKEDEAKEAVTETMDEAAAATSAEEEAAAEEHFVEAKKELREAAAEAQEAIAATQESKADVEEALENMMEAD